MAAAFGSFSIREYTSNMRTLDVVRSWPFGCESDEVKKETAEAFLPPITVTKFRWWSDELELLRSSRDKGNQVPELERTTDEIKIVNEEVEAENLNASEEDKQKFEKVCPVCRVFAASTVNAVNAHIDGCLAQASTEEQCQMKRASAKTKSRVPKKRSITEIFALAPPIEAIAMVEYTNDEKRHGDDLKQVEINKSKASKSRDLVSATETIKSTKKTKKKMKKDRILREKYVPIANRLNKYQKKFKNGKREKLIPTKESRLQVHHNKGQCVLPCKKRRLQVHREGILNIVSIKRNKPAIKSSSKQKKNKHFEQDELNSTQKVSMAPSRSILKRKSKVTTELGSQYSSLQVNKEEKFHGPQRSERHVRFSDRKVMLGSESFTALKEKEKSIEGNEEVALFEAGESRAISSDVQCPIEKRQSSNCHDQDEVPKFARRSAEKSSLTNEFVIQDKEYPTLSHENAFSDIPGGVAVSEERHKLRAKTQVHSNVSKAFDSYRQLIDRLGDPVHAGGKSSVTNSSFSIPSPYSAFSENANKRFSNPSRTEAQPFGSPAKMLAGRFPFPVAGSQNHVDSEFFGLPLNSLGELIHLDSSTINGFDQQMESRSVASSSNSLPLHNSFLPRCAGDYRTAKQMHHIERELPQYHFNLFPGSKKIQLPVGVADLEGMRRAEIQWLNFERGTNQPVNPLPLDSNSSTFNISFNGCRHLGKVQSQKEYHEYPTQQTMRLMGKDVAIGRSSKELQGVEGGKFWRNRENMIEYFPAHTSQYNPSGNQVFFQGQLGQARSEIPRQALVHQSRFQNNQRWQDNVQINNELGIAYRDGSAAEVSFKDNSRLNMHLTSHSSSSSPIFSLPSNFQQPCVLGAEAVPINLQSMMSSSQNSSQEIYGSASLPYKPNLVPPKSDLPFPFLRLPPDCRECVQSPTFPVFKSLPPWMSQSKQQEKAPCSSSRMFRSMNWSNLSHVSPPNSILNRPSGNHAPRVQYARNPTPSNSYPNNATSTPLFHPPFVPIIPGAKQTAPLNTLNIKDSGSYNKNNKRTPADKPIYPRKSPKIPISKMQDYVAGLTREKLAGGEQHVLTPTHLHSDQDGVGETRRCRESAASDNVDSIFTNNSQNMDSMARTGPIKLSAGAKHILKPSQTIDHDNAKPIHSTIPFAGFNNSVSFQETQKKSSRFCSV